MRNILAKINILANAFEKDGNLETADLLHNVFVKISKKKKSKSKKNVPNNPSLWAQCKAQAKQKFDVYPSAYANGWAAKQYKSKGGTWRKASVENVRVAQEVFQTEAEKFPEVVQISDEFYKAISSQDYDGAKELLEEMRNFNVKADTPELKNKTQQMLTFMTQSYNEALKRRTFQQDPQVKMEQESISQRNAVRGEEDFDYKQVIEKLKALYLSGKENEAETYLKGQLNFNRLFENPNLAEALETQFDRIKASIAYKQDYSAYERFYLLARKILKNNNVKPNARNIRSLMIREMDKVKEPINYNYLDNFVYNSLTLFNKDKFTRDK